MPADTLTTYDKWMKDTYSLTSPRSALLKVLDDAVKTQNPDAIKVALDRWRFDQRRQGKDWRESVRNGKGAVTALYRAVNAKRPLSAEEAEAFRYIARAQALALQKQFMGKTLTFKQGTLVGLTNAAGSKWERFKRDATTVGGLAVEGTTKGVSIARSGMKVASQVGSGSGSGTGVMAEIKAKVRTFCRDLCPGLDPDHVFRALNLGGVEHFATTLTPFIGAISSGGKALIGWGKVAASAYQRHSFESSRAAFKPGDPEAALDAVLALITREIASGSVRAGAKTVAFTGKLLGSFADFGAVTGPVIGLIELLAEVLQQVVEYVQEYTECQIANVLLRVGALNFDLFSVSPILGCYFLVVQDHSTIINFAVGEYGTANWMFDVEKLVAKVQPVLEKARLCIAASRYEIAGLSTAKGVVGPAYSHKGVVDKITSAPAEVQDRIGNALENWLMNPVKPPKVDKSRIVGFGSNVVDPSRIVGFGSGT